MKRIVFAALLATVAMPANAYEYLVYEGDGQGTWSDINGPSVGRPLWTPGIVTGKLVVPLSRPDDSSTYWGHSWYFEGSKVVGIQTDLSRYFGSIELYFDHILTEFPRSADGFRWGTIRFGMHYYGLDGTMDDLRVSFVESDELLGQVSASFAAFAAPEPASWAMMISGFGLVGGAMRRRAAGVRFAIA